MALKLIVDKLDDVPEALRGEYTEKDGKFHLGVDGLEDTGGLKTALQKERADRAAYEKQVKAWQGLGKSPDEIKELLEAQARADEDKATKAGEWDKLKAQMNEKHEAALRSKDETISAMRKRLNAELVDAKAVAAIAAAKGVPELLLPHVQRHVKVDADFNVQVVDDKGDPRVNGKGEPLTIADLVAEMRGSEVFGRAFEGSGQSGSGKQPGNGAGGAGVNRKSDFKTEKDRAAFVDKHGFEAYKALPD
jgi:DNA-binding transcriptional MerR regulator